MAVSCRVVSLPVLTVLLAAILTPTVASRQVYSHPKAMLPDGLLDDSDLEALFMDDAAGLVAKRDPVRGGMWFGPRLGRRKRSVELDSPLGQRYKSEELLKLLEDSPWTFIALKGGRRRTLNFTPRLGRDSDEDMGENLVDGYGRNTARPGTSGGSAVGGYFSNTFTPRLGRYADHSRPA